MINHLGIELADICKLYPKSDTFSLKDLSLSIPQGIVYGLLGPNGAGKTTLISILCGIIPATTGSIRYFDQGQPISEIERRQVIGFVPQDFAFYEELTAKQNLDYFGAMYNIPAAYLGPRRDELLEVLGLSTVAHKAVSTFSGGMKRRLNLAIGIIHRPQYLFLDEPTVGVDVQSKEAIVRYLKTLKQGGATIIYTSHHLAEAEEICDRIALIDHGRLVVEGTTGGLLENHEAPNLQALFLQLTGAAFRDQ
ncbi:ABC-2 type transport system ATP-binding protein [Dyadobacter jejuensis]|uniref:ABC-2 type transport system ATP-binding protein n=1 Tax=Dyadobacter jejuensis TaxID=1082580 RepID=A0A316AL38_9BACT|nr:ABC transporter ATP-binding protein [Dyadobacter jejuensis]PWJ58515.1 ABC-2 type transport system ATP-binding protein [Dyadobacter jejuensis]